LIPRGEAAVAGCALAVDIAMAETINFDTNSIGSAPSGWSVGVTGRGSFR